jgi:hypothetical protein
VQQHDELEGDAERMLVHLFRADDIENRGVDRIAEALHMEKGMLKYHLDCLQRANFAHMTSMDDVDVYWGITPEGRQYVVRRKLV